METFSLANFRTKGSVFAGLALVALAAVSYVAAQEEIAEQVARQEDIAAVPEEPPISDLDRKHWSFQPLLRPELPTVSQPDWCSNPIDRFVLRELEKSDLAPLPIADRETLSRRLCFDLTGLPPSAALRERFLADESPLAYERLVDELLGSTAFGEHWAQHWLDLVRFAETDGFEHDHVRPNAWRYRDWVIEALNSGMTYDEFLRRQLAGDELYPDDPQSIVATGFLLCGPDMPDINLQEERRHVVLNDMTGTVGGVLLGMTFECAACHDHKYDPISQFDFYRLRAFFETADLFQEQPIPTREDVAAVDQFERDRAAQWKLLEAEMQAVRTSGEDADGSRMEKLKSDLAALKKAKPPEMSMARAVHARPSGAPGAPGASRLWVRGDFRRPGPDVQPRVPRIASLSEEKNELRSRTALAEWLTSPDNPLTARVIVNRLWQHHFGQGLSDTPSDFGVMGSTPRHEELLDWLAKELISQDWDLKAMHRLIVTSTTYQLASKPEELSRKSWDDLLEFDPDNRLLGRRNRRRLSGEMVRDTLLTLTGDLNDNRLGPGIRPPLPAEITATLLKNQWPVTQNAADHNRRSIYLFVRRNLTYPLFQVLDKPDANRSCPARNPTTTAPQALELMNSEFMVERARQLANQIAHATHDDGNAFCEKAFQAILGRSASPAELQAAIGFLGEGSTESRTDLCLALLNSNAFLYVD